MCAAVHKKERCPSGCPHDAYFTAANELKSTPLTVPAEAPASHAPRNGLSVGAFAWMSASALCSSRK
jgi:hypothetical protein